MSENMDLKTFFKKYWFPISTGIVVVSFMATYDNRLMYILGVLFVLESYRSVKEDLKKHAYSTAKGIVAIRVLFILGFFLLIYIGNDGLVLGMTGDELDAKYPYFINGVSLMWFAIIMEGILKMKRFRKNG